MQRVVYYARVSTEEEKQIKALNTQVQELEGYIKTIEEWTLIEGYVDEGRSGTTIKGRREYQRLYNDILTERFDIIVIKDIDRLSRNTLNWYLFIDRLVQTGKKLFFYNIKEFYKVDDKLITGIRALIAEQYSRDLSIKINNAHKTRAKKARAVTNGKMWGYDQKDGKLLINEEEAEIVRLIFSLYVQGFGFRSIQKKIDEIGYTSRNGTSFAMTTLKRIIKNEKYIGTLICNKKHKDFDTKKIIDMPEEYWIIHENVIPPIIDKKTFDKAQEILESKKEKYGHNNIRGAYQGCHLYSKKIVCGTCNKTYWHQIYSKTSYELWQCQLYRRYGKNTEKGCNNPHVEHKILDTFVKKIIFNFIKNKKDYIGWTMEFLEKNSNTANDKKTYNNHCKKMDKLTKRRENLLVMRADGEISKEEFFNHKLKLENEIQIIQNLILEESKKNKKLKNQKDRLTLLNEELILNYKSYKEIPEDLIRELLSNVIIYNNNTIKVILLGTYEYKVSLDSCTSVCDLSWIELDTNRKYHINIKIAI